MPSRCHTTLHLLSISLARYIQVVQERGRTFARKVTTDTQECYEENYLRLFKITLPIVLLAQARRDTLMIRYFRIRFRKPHDVFAIHHRHTIPTINDMVSPTQYSSTSSQDRSQIFRYLGEYILRKNVEVYKLHINIYLYVYKIT